MFFTNHSGNVLVHFCMIYKRYTGKYPVCGMKKLEAHTLILVSFEGKLLQNPGGSIKTPGWDLVVFAKNYILYNNFLIIYNFKILQTAGEKTCCCLQ